jgi:hypothetical protein
MGGLFGLCGIGLAWWTFPLGVVSGLLLGLGIDLILRLVASRKHRRRLRTVGEVYLSEHGVYFEGRYHTWGFFGGQFSSASLVALRVLFEQLRSWWGVKPAPPEQGEPAVMVVAISYGLGSDRSIHELHVPVPEGREAEAQRLIQSWGGKGPRGGSIL